MENGLVYLQICNITDKLVDCFVLSVLTSCFVLRLVDTGIREKKQLFENFNRKFQT